MGVLVYVCGVGGDQSNCLNVAMSIYQKMNTALFTSVESIAFIVLTGSLEGRTGLT